MNPLVALVRAEFQQLRHAVAGLRQQSRLKVGVVSLGMLLLWLAIFALAWAGLRALDQFGVDMVGDAAVSISEVLMPRVLGLAAAVLQVMLVLSCALLAFQSYFRSAEMRLLVSTPLPLPALSLAKLGEVTFFGAWSAAYLGSPVLLAYGLVRHAPWTLYPVAVLAFVPFVVIPAAIGCMLALLVARFAPRLSGGWLVAAAGVLVVTGVLLVRPRLAETRFRETVELGRLVELSGRAHSPYLPSTWFAETLVAATRRDWPTIGFHLVMLTTNATFAAWLLGRLTQATLLGAWSTLASAAPLRRRVARHRWLARLLAGVPGPQRAMVVKDVLQLARDPAQWSQAVIFFGVLALYIANMRTTPRAVSTVLWQGWITLLNTMASLLVAATLTTRFVFPLLSLEGRRFWLLSLAPLPRRRLVWQKFWLSSMATASLTASLALLSGCRLGLPPASLGVSLFTVFAASVGLSALAVGLGATYPNFREENPGRIVSGLGGTLCFLLSVLYVALVATLQTFALSWSEMARHWGLGWPAATGIAACLAALLLLTLLTTWLPLRIGLRNFEQSEF